MSERTSLSSEGFHRSLVNLSQEYPEIPSFDVDELFASDEVRKKLAKKLLTAKVQRIPTSLEPEESIRKLPQHAFMTPEGSLEAEPESTMLGLRYAPSGPEPSLADVESTAVDRTSRLSVESGPPIVFSPWRVFVNCVDTFNGKHIAQFLSEQMLGGTKSDEPEEVKEEQELFGEEEEDLPRVSKKEIPRMNIEIFGSLLKPDGKYDKEIISKIVDTSDKIRLLKKLKNCSVIIYDISRYENQIREARWILQTILYEIMLMEKWDPERFAQLTDIPTFILISTFMTWANTKPPGPFQEAEYKKRKAHPNYVDHFKLEKEVLAAGKMYPKKYKTIVLCSGVQYGYEQDMLNFLFKFAWENEPALPLYAPPKNAVPLIHIRDLATMIYTVIEDFPVKQKFLLAVEQGKTTIKKLTKAISKGLTSGEIVTLPNEQMKFLRLSKHINESLSANVPLEPEYFVNSEKMNWTSEAPFVPNIRNIINEYLEFRNLGAKRILVTGPPASGKTTLSKKLCGYYRLHYLNPDYVSERSMKTLQNKIDAIRAKELAALEKEMEKAEEEQAEEEEDEEEEAEEEEEEERETLESLTEELEELKGNIKENDGHLDEDHLLRCLRKLLASYPLRNQGYVLDGFPETVRQVRQVFKASGEGEEEEEVVEDEEEEIPEDTAPFPDFVISLEASDEFLMDRVKEMTEYEIKAHNYEEETFKQRLAKFRIENTDETGILNYFDERELHPLIVDVELDQSDDLEDTLANVKKNIGEPQNFGLSAEEEEEKKKLDEELAELLGEKSASEEEKEKQRLHAERMRKLEQWALTMDALRQEEEEMEEAQGLALRHYLMRYVFPTLTRGLLELERARPLDPLDFLAEFLFKENPEGTLFEPEHTAQSRKFFQDLLKCRETLFSLTCLEKEEEDMFFPKDVLENQEEEYDTYY